ncbi:MAG: hypothetical protein RMI91_05780 [Gemmatales bacterium]|nr:hypothetical protein [Gemmatales bacterium]MDW7994145.1 hypothetical protein [Gemmatales bacterium]
MTVFPRFLPRLSKVIMLRPENVCSSQAQTGQRCDAGMLCTVRVGTQATHSS